MSDTDDLLLRIRRAVGAGQMIKALDDGVAEIERLTAAHRLVVDNLAERNAECEALKHDIERHIAIANEYMRDAERYRWLRDRHEYNIAASEIVQEVSGEGWDAAIDRARGEGK